VHVPYDQGKPCSIISHLMSCSPGALKYSRTHQFSLFFAVRLGDLAKGITFFKPSAYRLGYGKDNIAPVLRIMYIMLNKSFR
jgi:hypothetical protein